jgi:hypothetical protein
MNVHLSPAALDAAIKLLDGPQNPRSFGDILETAAIRMEARQQ